MPILFLATAAIDFDEPDRHAAAQREEERYFKITKRLENGEVEGDWKSPEARKEFKTRLKTMYDMLFTQCMKAGVTHPGFLPIGLGAFLPRIQSDDVKTVYHEAQFELLAERDYNFKYYFLNPGPGRRQVLCLLCLISFPLPSPTTLSSPPSPPLPSCPTPFFLPLLQLYIPKELKLLPVFLAVESHCC